MKTTYTAGVDLFLLNNEISMFTPNRQTMLYSTDKTYSDIGVHLLDRNRFVKPTPCPITKAYEELPNIVKKHLNYVSFEVGYRANKNEFTREEMEECNQLMFDMGRLSKEGLESPQYYFSKGLEVVRDKLKPLSLPESVTIENNEIIEVKWS